MKHILTTLLFTLLALTTQAQTLTDTYWRNAKTGEWLIGFAENHVIYDCRTWKVLSSSEKKDKRTSSSTAKAIFSTSMPTPEIWTHSNNWLREWRNKKK